MSNAIFLVTGEKSCPYYDTGDEIKVESNSVSISSFKPVCVYLTAQIEKILSAPGFAGSHSPFGGRQFSPKAQQTQFDCGGCDGLIQFKFKQEKDYATIQMKLLRDSEEQRKRQHLQKYYGFMRQLELFNSLEDEALTSLTTYLEFKSVLPLKVLIEKGAPGTHLYIILSGEVDVIGESGQKVSKMESGEIFGEMSLLSGEAHSDTLHTSSATKVAMLSVKNFRKILKKHPSLQIFLFKLLINQVQAMALRAGNISSGMTGDLQEMPAVDLMQLINSSQKTGVVHLSSVDGKAEVFFNEGEIIRAQYGDMTGKEAVFAILKLKDGHFTYNRGIADELTSLPPLGGFIGLIMEGLQRIDEQGAP